MGELSNVDIFKYLMQSRHYVIAGCYDHQVIDSYLRVAKSLGLLQGKKFSITPHNSSLLPGEKTEWLGRCKQRVLEAIAKENPVFLKREDALQALRKPYSKSSKRAVELVGLLYECNGNGTEADEIEDTFTDVNSLTKRRYNFPSSASRQHKSDQIRRDRN